MTEITYSQALDPDKVVELNYESIAHLATDVCRYLEANTRGVADYTVEKDDPTITVKVTLTIPRDAHEEFAEVAIRETFSRILHE